MSDLPERAAGWLAGGEGRAVVRCRDLVELRRARPTGRASAVGIWLDEGDSVLSVVPPPTWPLVRAQLSRVRADGVWTTFRFADEVDVAEVVAEVGRQAVWHGTVVERAPAVDTRLLNPTGFLVRVEGATVDAADLDLRDGATPGLVKGLREHAGVRVTTWDDAVLAAAPGLAAAGVPLTADDAPADRLGVEVAAAITTPVDLDDPLAREEHSIVLRRAALDAFAPTAQPPVSILLATRRPDMLEHALGQVARQRGVERLELVLAPHGFEVPVERVREAVGDAVAVQVRSQPAETLFGDVLHAAATAADGEVVMKWDDDDWYSPDVVADLLRARAYSGGDLVGMPAEQHYVAPADVTVVKGHDSETWSRFVAGGTLMLERALLREIGSFRQVRRFVDAQLLEAVLAAGGAVYRTHGLGYVLHRTDGGHTWHIDLDDLLDPDRMVGTRPGLAPSRLLEL